MPATETTAATIAALGQAWTAAERAIADLLAAKGYGDASARINREGARFCCTVETPHANPFNSQHPPRQYFFGDTLSEACGKAVVAIGSLAERGSVDAWFDPAHPMNRPAPKRCAHCDQHLHVGESMIAVAGGAIHGRCEQYWRTDPRNPANAPKRPRKPFGLVIASDGMPETYGHEGDAA